MEEKTLQQMLTNLVMAKNEAAKKAAADAKARKGLAVQDSKGLAKPTVVGQPGGEAARARTKRDRHSSDDK